MTPTQIITQFCNTASTAYKAYPTKTFPILQKYAISVDPAVFLVTSSFNENNASLMITLSSATSDLSYMITQSQNDSFAAPGSTPQMPPIKVPCPCPEIATTAEAVAGVNTTKFMTPLRTKQAINGAEIWNTVTTAGTHTMVAGQSYISTYSGLTTFKLPLVSKVGQKISIVTTAGTLLVTQNALQSIVAGAVGTSTVGTAGNLSSASIENTAVTLICTVANTKWAILSNNLLGTEAFVLND